MTLTENANYSTAKNQLPESGPDLRLIQGTLQNQQLVSWLSEQFKTCQENRYQFESQWYLNLAFYHGKQWVDWGPTKSGPTARLVESPAPPWRVRLIINQTRRYVRKEYAKVTREQPSGFVLPNSNDDNDLLGAIAGDQIAESLWRDKKIHLALKKAAFWAMLCGSGFVKFGYDIAKQVPLASGEVYTGDCYVDRITPFHLYVPDVQEEDIENQAYVINLQTKPSEWVEQAFGVKIQASVSYNSGIMEDKFLRAMGINENKKKNLVYLKEIWVKPGHFNMFPNGGIVVWANESEVIRVVDGWPYPPSANGYDFPFCKVDHIPTGRFYAESVITDLIPLQKEYNRTRSQLVEAKNRMAKPQLLAAKGSVNPRKITTEPGLVIEYTPGFEKPTPLELASIPQYVIEELERTLREMDDLTSQHEISRGQVPSGITAATAISFLQEQDDSVFAPATESIEEASEKITRAFLQYVNAYWEDDRLVRLMGDNGQFEAFAFSKSNLRGNTDYHVHPGSATPRSLAAKQAFIMELYKLGAIPGEKMLRYLQMAETGRLYEEMQVDQRQAQRENLKMTFLQQPINTNAFDNHIAHIMEHRTYKKKQQYESLPDEIKQLHFQHERVHMINLAALYGYYTEDPFDPQLDMIVNRLLMGIPPDVGGMAPSNMSPDNPQALQQPAPSDENSEAGVVG